jgi:hypothetical protein
MEMEIPVSQDLALRITDRPDGRMEYPTSSLLKALVLTYRGRELAEEAVGFGVPVLKQGLETVFPGEVVLELAHTDSTWTITADYCLNRVERMSQPNKTKIGNPWFYAAKNSLSAFMVRFAPARGPLTALSSGLRGLFGWKTTYVKAGFSIPVKMTYAFDQTTGVLSIEADLAGLPPGRISEVIVMIEQGAHYFNQYSDSSGKRLSGKGVGSWDEVTAEEASFASNAQQVAFSVHQVPGARLFRGRELIGARLAWSGFGYSFPPTQGTFGCTIRIIELP